MSDDSETPKILDQIAKGTGSKTGTRSQQNARRRFYILLLLFIPVLGGLAYVSYLELSVQQRLVELENQNASQTASIANYEQQLATLTAQLAEIPGQVQVDDTVTVQLGNRLDEEINAVRAELQSLTFAQQQSEDPQPRQWRILEAEYLLDLAARKLQFESDINAAILLLEESDRALQDSEGTGVFAARRAVGADLSTLRALEPVDREGLYIRLQNLVTQVADLPLRGSMRDEFEQRLAGQSSDAQSDANSEAGMLDRTFEFLGTVFVWRQWEEMPEAILAPGQDMLIRQRLRLTLEQLQLALTRADGELFGRGLGQSLALFESTLVVDEPVSAALLTELRSMQEIDIDPVLPTLAASRESVGQLAAGLR